MMIRSSQTGMSQETKERKTSSTLLTTLLISDRSLNISYIRTVRTWDDARNEGQITL